MGLFEDMVINAKAAASAVGKKAGKAVDISKLRMNAADLNNEIAKRFEALGRVVYDAKKAGTSSDELVGECVTAIDELYEQLDAVNEQLAAKRCRVTCRNCGQDNPANALYCSKCGQKLQEDVPPAQAAPAEEPTAAADDTAETAPDAAPKDEENQ
ncbi:MAG: zinc ribbon domain-containing protein [Oscillospiraceae bacterium]|jgi:ribosomal protein L40E|nr:zinc ribbon domain-containing protein [Oscillospiraceae bacterium]MDD3260716.1 zinc ribbon domain-containing protein [Oscillospiraceae bacterium]